MTREELKAAAVSMLERSYCPYSHFPVGAALEVICLDKDGNELALSLTDLLPHSFNKSFL